ncbi:hypothetical protein Tco_1185390, partial [Tanacetum coccineum]
MTINRPKRNSKPPSSYGDSVNRNANGKKARVSNKDEKCDNNENSGEESVKVA